MIPPVSKLPNPAADECEVFAKLFYVNLLIIILQFCFHRYTKRSQVFNDSIITCVNQSVSQRKKVCN
jgi:hypothetical protein